MTRMGLHMIVKNEAAVVERCLLSVRPLVDWWVISDTGSTDGTQELVQATMAGVPGRLLERPWVSFGHNRHEALAAARELAESAPDDYVMWIDADEELVDLPRALPELTADGYFLQLEYGETRYARLAIVRLDRPWRWTGAIHEYLDLPDAALEHLANPRVVVRHEGARANDPDTYRHDAAVIQAELRADPEDPRLQFYLGQSWRDAGEPGLALKAFRARAANPTGWEQERWYAAFQVAVCLERLAAPADQVRTAYLDAYAAGSSRAEPLVELARHERVLGRCEVALLYARAAAALPVPPLDDLFVDRSAHTWRPLDEIALSCWQTERFEEGQRAAAAAVSLRPDDARLVENLRWFLDRPGAPPEPADPGV